MVEGPLCDAGGLQDVTDSCGFAFLGDEKLLGRIQDLSASVIGGQRTLGDWSEWPRSRREFGDALGTPRATR